MAPGGTFQNLLIRPGASVVGVLLPPAFLFPGAQLPCEEGELVLPEELLGEERPWRTRGQLEENEGPQPALDPPAPTRAPDGAALLGPQEGA